MKTKFTTVVTDDLPAPPDMYDMDERDKAQNEAYCRELQARMLAFELDPRNFHRLKGGSKASYGKLP
jgi:hypothetical protein